MENNNNLFKKGSQYTRNDVGWIVLPETGRPAVSYLFSVILDKLFFYKYIDHLSPSCRNVSFYRVCSHPSLQL